MIDLVALAKTTLRSPRDAARTIMAMDLPRDVLWTALALVAVINAIVLHVMLSVSPPEMQAQFPGYFGKPMALFLLLAGVMVIYIHSVFWAGLSLGGTGRLDDMLALLVWLQMLRTCVQLFVLLLTFTVPALAGLVSILAFIWAFWILLSFVAEAVHLPTTGHAFVALAMALIGLVLGLGIMLAVMGTVAQGILTNV